jgi:hypothetical protein
MDIAAIELDRHIFHQLHELRRETVELSSIEHAVTLARDVTQVGVAQPRRRLDQRVQNGLEVERRTADHLEHVGGGGLLLQRFAQFIEQPRVLDGDNGLVGESLNKFDFPVGVQRDFATIKADYTYSSPRRATSAQ